MTIRKAQKKSSDADIVSWDNIIKENKEINFVLSKKQMEKILEQIGNSMDKENFIIDKKTGARELAIDSGEIKSEEIGAVFPGSKVFVKKNVAGFSQYLADYYDGT